MKKTGKPAPASKQAIAKVLLPAPAVAVVPKATASHGVSVDERFEAGKALRDKIPRIVQAVWKRPSDWPDPVSVLQASDPGRLPELIPIRYGCVLQSPSVFFRGAAAVMAGDMAATPEVAKLHRPATPGVCPLIAKAAAPSPTKSWNVDTAPAASAFETGLSQTNGVRGPRYASFTCCPPNRQQAMATAQASGATRPSRFLHDPNFALPHCCLQRRVVTFCLIRIGDTEAAHRLIEILS